MSYVLIAHALYDYQATADDELTLAEDEGVYVLDNTDPEWWKVKRRAPIDANGYPQPFAPGHTADDTGLVPAAYVEPVEPIRVSAALYDYSATAEEELSIKEDEPLDVYEYDGEWLLVKKHEDPNGRVGFVPANYVEEADAQGQEAAHGGAEDYAQAQDAYQEQEPQQEEAPPIPPPPPPPPPPTPPMPAAAPAAAAAPVTLPPPQRSLPPPQRSLPSQTRQPSSEEEEDEDTEYESGQISKPSPPLGVLSSEEDAIKMWSVSILDAKKKKRKGTVGIGSGSVFFSSDSDKIPSTTLKVLAINDAEVAKKQVTFELEPGVSADMAFSEGGADLIVVIANNKDDARDIATKLVSSQTTTRKAKRAASQAAAAAAAEAPPSLPARAPNMSPPPGKVTSALDPGSGEESATALYDFEAAGDDELTVAENEQLIVIDKENDDWWKVRNGDNAEGVVPASYVEVTGPPARSASAPGAAGGDHLTHRRVVEEEAELVQQEKELAALEAQEAERSRSARAAEIERRKKEIVERRRREEEDLDRSRSAPPGGKGERRTRFAEDDKGPSGAGDKPSRKPSRNNTRVWHDKTGQFKVEAEFLGFHDGKIRLHKMNGVVIEVAVEKMSMADIQFLEDITGRRLRPKDDDDTPLANVAGPRRRTTTVEDDVTAGRKLRDYEERGDQEHERRRALRDQREREKERERERERNARSRAESERLDRLERELAREKQRALEAEQQREKDKERERRDQQQQRNKTKRPNRDWFEWFLAAGVDLDDCTRYANAFERDKIDEAVLPDLDPSVLRSLGLREGDIIRVRKYIQTNYGSGTSGAGSTSSPTVDQDQIASDEALARKIQEEERAARRSGKSSGDAPGLFSQADGTLKNNTRRGRPQNPRNSTLDSVDASSLQAATDALRSNSPPPRKTSAPPASNGFDDDAWTNRPASAKPATSAPPPLPGNHPAQSSTPKAASPAPAPAPASASAPAPTPPRDPNQDLLDKLAAIKTATPPTQQPTPLGGQFTGMPSASPQPGAFGVPTPQPRGPIAPVPQNQGLLQPLVPTSGTGQFMPTHTGMPMGMQPTGMPPMQTGMGMNPMQTGMGMQGMHPMQTGMMGMQPMQTGMMGMQHPMQTGTMGMPMQPMATGMPQQFGQPQPTGQQSMGPGFGSLSAQAQQEEREKDMSPGNVFAQMKSGAFAQDSSDPQSSDKYDPLRGFSQGGVIYPQQTGWYQ